jgi:hypothetical protein
MQKRVWALVSVIVAMERMRADAENVGTSICDHGRESVAGECGGGSCIHDRTNTAVRPQSTQRSVLLQCLIITES